MELQTQEYLNVYMSNEGGFARQGDSVCTGDQRDQRADELSKARK